MPILSYRFLPSEAEHASAVTESMHAEVHQQLSKSFKIPGTFWGPVAQEASGFFGSEDYQGEDGAQGFCGYLT